MLAFLTSKLVGPIASGVAVLLALALAFSLISAHATEHSLNARISTLEKSIDDPSTGWRARLGQCQANTATLSTAIDAQNAQVDAWKKTAADESARADANAAQAQIARTTAAKSATAVLNLKPGADHCASALDLIRSH